MITKTEQICPVEMTAKMLGNKWKILILRNLFEKDHYFGELKTGLSGISQKVLTENLRALEDIGVVSRLEETNDKVVKVRYSLTAMGRSMRPILDAMKVWGDGYIGENPDKAIDLANTLR